jgi:hypothetical protein
MAMWAVLLVVLGMGVGWVVIPKLGPTPAPSLPTAEREAEESRRKQVEAEEKRLADERAKLAEEQQRLKAEQEKLAKEQQLIAQAKAEAEKKKLKEQAEAAEKKRREQAEAEAARSQPSYLEDAGGGVLRQPSRGLEWTQSDNGYDIDWDSARSYCASKGGGWRLPTVAELQSLYDRSLAGVGCGGGTCYVSPLFRLTNIWFWSNEPNGSSEAWYVTLGYGARNSNPRSVVILRALCVRPS